MGLANLAELFRSSGIAMTTLRRYMALLGATYLVLMLPSWSAGLGKRAVKAPKLLFSDSGILAYLLGLEDEAVSPNSPLLGALLENFVAKELRKQASWSRSQPGLFHYRTRTAGEVDLVLEDARGRVVGVEVKTSATVGQDDFAGLRNLAAQTGERFVRGVVLHTGREAVPFGANLLAMPISTLWNEA